MSLLEPIWTDDYFLFPKWIFTTTDNTFWKLFPPRLNEDYELGTRSLMTFQMAETATYSHRSIRNRSLLLRKTECPVSDSCVDPQPKAAVFSITSFAAEIC